MTVKEKQDIKRMLNLINHAKQIGKFTAYTMTIAQWLPPLQKNEWITSTGNKRKK